MRHNLSKAYMKGALHTFYLTKGNKTMYTAEKSELPADEAKQNPRDVTPFN